MHAKWVEFLKKEKIRTRIYLKNEENQFLENLFFVDYEYNKRAPYAVEYVLNFMTKEKENLSIAKVSAANGKMYLGDVPPFITWYHVQNGEKQKIEEESIIRLYELFLKELLKK